MMTAMRGSLPLTVLPALKPNQPKNRMNVPMTTYTMLWPLRSRTSPFGPYLPMRAPTV